MFGCLIALLTAVLLASGPTADIAARITNLGDGTLGFSYAVRDGVTGNGRGVRVKIGSNSSASFYRGYHGDMDEFLEEGPAHATVRVRRGQAVSLDVVVGGSEQQTRILDVNLDEVAPAAAAHWFVGLMEHGDRDAADEAALGAAIADDDEDIEYREHAVFALAEFEDTSEVVTLFEEILTE